MNIIAIFDLALKLLSLIYLFFILFLIRGISKVKNINRTNKLRASVIVPFRNEERNLRRTIESILNQDIEKDRFEIILVDDNSKDNSIESVKDLIENNNLRLIKLHDGMGKKKAIETGINQAKNEIIVTTDADCYHQKAWLRSLIECFDEETGFVAGKVVYDNVNNFFEELQKIEFASLVSIGAALIGNNIPLLANGASCAYRKDLFFMVGGFSDNLNLASGDEEFLMQKIHFDAKYKIKFCSAENSSTFTEPIKSFSKFLNQRKRWVSKVPFYRNKLLLPVLVLLYLFYVFFLPGLALIFVNSNLSKTIFLIFGFKSFIDLIFMVKGYKLLGLLKRKYELLKLIIFFPIAEFFHFIYISLIPILSFLTGFKWKGRKFKR